MTLLLVTEGPRSASLRFVPCDEHEAEEIARTAFRDFGVSYAALFSQVPAFERIRTNLGRLASLPGMVALYVKS